MTELCRVFGISRKTGYKWLARFKEGGAANLHDRSRRFKHHPHTTPDAMVALIVGARKRHPTWGPKKIHAWLERRKQTPPATSTIGEILRREGLLKKRRRKPRAGEFTTGLTAQDHPNAVWAADFKGWFRLATGPRCYPLTISDGFSRFLLRCEALAHPDELSSKEVFDAAFVEFGLPNVLRTDNGTPFSARYGVSALSLWWVKLGIRPERIARGKPTQNGRHERIHRTLKAEAIGSGKTKRTMSAQQRVFDRFRLEYNVERPHEALDFASPASIYEPSPRRYPTKLRSPEYAEDWTVVRADKTGSIALPGRTLFLSVVLRGEPIGLHRLEDGSQRIQYGPLFLGSLSAEGRFSRGTRKRRRCTDPDDDKNEISTP